MMYRVLFRRVNSDIEMSTTFCCNEELVRWLIANNDCVDIVILSVRKISALESSYE